VRHAATGSPTLSATIKDITAENSDPATDPFAGDIRNARVSFVDRDGGVIVSNLAVGLVDPSDTKTGTVTFNWNVNIGAADSMDYTIGIVVSNYYTRNSSFDDVVVTVSKPIGTNFITGGGYRCHVRIKRTVSGSGQYEGKLRFQCEVQQEQQDAPGDGVKRHLPRGGVAVFIRSRATSCEP
jgi:hypothetical protein